MTSKEAFSNLVDKFHNQFDDIEIIEMDTILQDLNRKEKLENQIKDGTLSDGYHTFNDLYYQRCILFATIVNQNKSISWKSKKHEDGELCFGGNWFIVGIDTPQGSYTYHYENKYWNLFQCIELDKGKHWDGHTSEDVTRLLSLLDIKALEDNLQIKCRPCIVNGKEARFHKWVEISIPVINDGIYAGSRQFTLGLVEYQDGTVEEVTPHKIRFTDKDPETTVFLSDGTEIKVQESN